MSTLVDFDGDGLVRCLFGGPDPTTTIGRLRDYWGNDPDEWGMLGPQAWSDEETIRCELRENPNAEGDVEVWFERRGDDSVPWFVCINRPFEITDIPPESVCEHASPIEKARMLRQVLEDGQSWIMSTWIKVLSSKAHELPPALWREVWSRVRSSDTLCHLLTAPAVVEMLDLTAAELLTALSDDELKVRRAALQALEHLSASRSPSDPESPDRSSR